MIRHKRKRQPYLPPSGDTGPDTAAQRAGAVYITDVEANGQQFLRKRHEHILDKMARGNRRRSAMISDRQCAAGLKLHARYCETMRSPPSAFTRPYVDCAPNPAMVVLHQCEAVERLARLTRHIPRGMESIVFAVCCEGRSIRPGVTRDALEADSLCAQLQVALDILGNELGL